MGLGLLEQGLVTLVGAALLGQSLVASQAYLDGIAGRLLAQPMDAMAEAASARARAQWGSTLAALPKSWVAADLASYASGPHRLDMPIPFGGTLRAHVVADSQPNAVRIVVCPSGGDEAPGGVARRAVRVLRSKGVFISPTLRSIDGPSLMSVTLPGFAPSSDCVVGAHVYLTAERAVPEALSRTEIDGLPEATRLRADIDLGGNKLTNAEEIVVTRATVIGTIEAGEVNATGRLQAGEGAFGVLRATSSCSGC